MWPGQGVGHAGASPPLPPQPWHAMASWRLLPQLLLSFLSSVLQPHLLGSSLLRGLPLCLVGAPTHLPLPEAPGCPWARGLTDALGSPCCHPSSVTRHSTCMPLGPSTSSARPQVSGAPVLGWGARMGRGPLCKAPFLAASFRPIHSPSANLKPKVLPVGGGARQLLNRARC